MITVDRMMAIPKSDLPEASAALGADDIAQLIQWLSLKEDSIRYQAFLLLQSRSLVNHDVYRYWDTFRSKLSSENSYQRSIGLMLIAENVIWDTENRMEDTIHDYLALLNDEKPITVRQCIQSLGKIALSKPGLADIIASGLVSMKVMDIKETMRKSILLDILNVLLAIRKEHTTEKIEGFILNALSGEILDTKSKKQVEAAYRSAV